MFLNYSITPCHGSYSVDEAFTFEKIKSGSRESGHG